jgi:hypothetical protein
VRAAVCEFALRYPKIGHRKLRFGRHSIVTRGMVEISDFLVSYSMVWAAGTGTFEPLYLPDVLE